MAVAILTHARLIELLHYDPETGEFTNLKKRGRLGAGMRAGAIDHEGYRLISIDKARYRAGRLAWFWFYGAWPTHQIDHLDGNHSNDAISNLRDAEPRINAQNKHGPTRANKTRRLGVYPNGSGFMAQATINGRAIYLGTFRSADEAEAVALQARRQLYRGFTR